MWDNDIENAIEQLQKSSTAIEKYTEALRTQQETLVAVMNTIGKNHTTRTAAENVQFRGWMTENKQTRFEVFDISRGGPEYELILDRLMSYCMVSNIKLLSLQVFAKMQMRG